MGFMYLGKLILVLVILAAMMVEVKTVAASSNDDQQLTILGNALPPFSLDNDGELKGFAVELLNTLLINHYGNSVVTESLTVPFSRVLVTIKNKQRTLATNIACTPERMPKYNWLGPYYDFTMALIGREDDDTDYQTLMMLLIIRL